jgi:hypothetical protein
MSATTTLLIRPSAAVEHIEAVERFVVPAQSNLLTLPYSISIEVGQSTIFLAI